jgi:hypothetical protein
MPTIHSGHRGPELEDANPAMPNDTATAAELAEERLDTEGFKRKLAQACGGLLDAGSLQAMLGSTQDEVHRASAQRRILAVEDDGQLRYPHCQFDGGDILPGIRAILTATPNMNGWRLLQYLYGREDGLSGNRPINLIQGCSTDLEKTVHFAGRLEE